MKHILLTGGAGYIGSHTALSLLEKGYKVSIFDSLINSKKETINRIKNLLKIKEPELIQNFKFIEGDLREIESVRKLFNINHKSKSKFDAVIHLAGLKAVGESVSKPLEYWECNVFGTLNLLKIMEENNCKIIIFSSSATIYSQISNKLINENEIIKPQNPYGSTKAAIEQILFEIYKSSIPSWKIINLRYFNPIGAHPSGLIGEEPVGKPNNIFPIILQVAANNSQIFNIYGDDWDTHDGTGVRDYIHIVDLSNGHVRALEFLLENQPQYLSLNLGTGIGTSVLELIKSFEIANKIKIPYNITKRRKGDVGFTVADNSLAKKTLNWEPKKDIKQMCIDGWKWQKYLIKISA